MISHITGTVLHTDLRYLVVDAHGVGYKVFITPEIVATVGSTISLWTYLAVRENALDLYGFHSQDALAFFELLITVSGIGPKTALGILSAASVDTLHNAIESGDTSDLTKVSGIGKKNAEKIVLELRDKIDGWSALNHSSKPKSPGAQSDGDVIEALKALGYTHNESRDALKKIDKTLIDTGAKVKAALKLLGN